MSILGLVLDILGVFILFFNSPDIPTILADGSDIVIDSRDDEKGKQNAKTAQKRIKLSRYALALIIAGFIFQLIGQFTAD